MNWKGNGHKTNNFHFAQRLEHTTVKKNIHFKISIEMENFVFNLWTNTTFVKCMIIVYNFAELNTILSGHNAFSVYFWNKTTKQKSAKENLITPFYLQTQLPMTLSTT